MPGTWLLDANVPIQLISVLAEFGIESETALARGWRRLSNGELVKIATAAGFQVLLTRDREFAASAAKALTHFPQFAIVVIALPQARIAEFRAAFKASWLASPIRPVPGQMKIWPSP